MLMMNHFGREAGLALRRLFPGKNWPVRAIANKPFRMVLPRTFPG
jgi:hypothetical protein